MAYVLDDGWDNCGPVARAGNACFGLYTRCGIWVARNLTDGFIPGEIAAAYGSPEQARKLVDVGLWEAVDGGYLAVDYLTLNATAEKVRKRRQAESERKARWRANAAKSKRGTKKGPFKQANPVHAGQDAGIPRDTTRDKTRDGRSTFPSSKEERGARPATQGAARTPEPPPPAEWEQEPQPPDWRKAPAFGTVFDPDAQARKARGLSAVRAAAAAKKQHPPIPRGEGLKALDAAVIELRPRQPEAPDAQDPHDA